MRGRRVDVDGARHPGARVAPRDRGRRACRPDAAARVRHARDGARGGELPVGAAARRAASRARRAPHERARHRRRDPAARSAHGPCRAAAATHTGPVAHRHGDSDSTRHRRARLRPWHPLNRSSSWRVRPARARRRCSPPRSRRPPCRVARPAWSRRRRRRPTLRTRSSGLQPTASPSSCTSTGGGGIATACGRGSPSATTTPTRMPRTPAPRHPLGSPRRADRRRRGGHARPGHRARAPDRRRRARRHRRSGRRPRAARRVGRGGVLDMAAHCSPACTA